MPAGTIPRSALLWLVLEAARRHVAEQRKMRMLREPRLADTVAHKCHCCAAGPIIGCAVLAIASTIEDRHADRLQAIGRDNGADVGAEAEFVDVLPDVAPLLLFRDIAAGHEVGEGAERDHVGCEDW